VFGFDRFPYARIEVDVRRRQGDEGHRERVHDTGDEIQQGDLSFTALERILNTWSAFPRERLPVAMRRSVCSALGGLASDSSHSGRHAKKPRQYGRVRALLRRRQRPDREGGRVLPRAWAAEAMIGEVRRDEPVLAEGRRPICARGGERERYGRYIWTCLR